MSNIYFMCDNCGIETNGITFVNGMKFCAKCYHQIFGKDNQQTEIAQLKQQLAEKDKEIKKLNWQLKDKDFTIKNLNHSLSVAPNANAGQRARIDELTKIVKEKDKEIEDLSLQIANLNSKITQMEEQNMIFHNQLAMQELEKVKDRIKHFCNIHSDDYYGVKSQVKGVELDICEEIDNQIKELKGE